MILKLCRIISFLLATTIVGCNRQYDRILEAVYDKDQAVLEWTVISSLSYDEIITFSK